MQDGEKTSIMKIDYRNQENLEKYLYQQPKSQETQLTLVEIM